MTKYHAVLFMCNDLKRAKFVIEGFTKHNPHIPLTVYNGGKKCGKALKKYDIELIEGRNLWHTNTRHKPGSFDFGWFEWLFKLHEQYDPDYLIFLETDVMVTRKIEVDPKYDLSGVMTRCGFMERLTMYDFWDAYIKDVGFHENQYTNWEHKFHTGMGGTAFSRNFFLTCKDKLHYVQECYRLIPMSCYQDVLISCFARCFGCTIGDWSEVSDTRGTLRFNNGLWDYSSVDINAALIHNYKI